MLSLLTPLCYGLMVLSHAYSQEFVVQDDMRHHVVWLQQFVDPTLFQNDAIAQYFRSVAPIGFSAFYWLGARVGIEPLLLAKLLPLPLALIATGFVFRIVLAIAPVPLAAWLATLIFNQHLWLDDDLVSATPRAFLYPLFAAFLYFYIERALLPTIATIALLGAFYPPMLLLAAAFLIVQLVRLQAPLPYMTRDRREWRFAIPSLLVAAAAVALLALDFSDYGAVVTVEQMRSQPEYGLGGRVQYFGVSPLAFVFQGESGLRVPIFPSIIWVGFALPFLGRWRSPTMGAVSCRVRVLIDLLVASLGLYLLAHLLLPRIHFPNRYTSYSWRFGLSIAAGIVLAALIEKGVAWWQARQQQLAQQSDRRSGRERLAIGLSGLAAAVVIGVPLIPPLALSFQGWIVGDMPAIYAYLRKQPSHTVVASLALEADNIPAFTYRSTWVGREFALPHHPQYYDIIRTRTAALLQAQYSADLSDLTGLAATAGIDFFLVERSAFEPEYLQKDWLLQSLVRDRVAAIVARLARGQQPALATALPSCGVVATQRYVLVDPACLRQLDSGSG